MEHGQDIPPSGGGCPLDPDCTWRPEYPASYKDPPWEPAGDPEEDRGRFAETVMPARRAAFQEVLNGHLAEHGIHGVEFVWETLKLGEEPQ